MSIPTIVEQQEVIADVLRGVAGIKRVFVDYPKAIDRAWLPCILLTPIEATYDRNSEGADSLTVSRDWRVQIMASSVEHGRDGDAEASLKPLIDATMLELAKNPTLTTADGRAIWLTLHEGGDTGVRAILHAGKMYIGTNMLCQTDVSGYVAPMR